jgi:hypothetical protein
MSEIEYVAALMESTLPMSEIEYVAALMESTNSKIQQL